MNVGIRRFLLSRLLTSSQRQTMSNLNFDNFALRALPVDKGPNQVRIVRNACFAYANPTPVENPRLVVASKPAFDLIGLPFEVTKLGAGDNELANLVACLAGNQLWSSSQPAAHCYCGHQFGAFSGQLGDGAVIYLGEVVNDNSERWEVQLKGAGLTPFSRNADGRKVLRSSLREFLCSEAMHHLGIPSTRAASVVTSNTFVERDMFYDGHVIRERASITCRVAPSFIRFGSFEITKPQDPLTGRVGPSFGNPNIIGELTTYVVKEFYPQIWSRFQPSGAPSADLYLAFFEEVVQRTARLVACWQTVGFCHGVLNTDNMSILGLTMDYGPFGFVDRFSWDHVCNSSDTDGRYSYAQQPTICQWNCICLANCLVRSLMDQAAAAAAPATTSSPSDDDGSGEQRDSSSALMRTRLANRFTGILKDRFETTFDQCYRQRMRQKLGLFSDRGADDKELFKSLLDTMDKTGADFTNTFLALEEILANASTGEDGVVASLSPDILIYQCCDVEELLEACKPDENEMQHRLLLQLVGFNRRLSDGIDPRKVVSIQEKAFRRKEMKRMTNVEKRARDASLWRSWLDVYAARVSSDRLPESGLAPDIADRLQLMRTANPRVVLRNHLAEQAIRAAEHGDYTVIGLLLQALETPFETSEALRRLDALDLASSLSTSGDRVTTRTDSDPPTTAGSVTPELRTGRPLSITASRPPKWARKLRVS